MPEQNNNHEPTNQDILEAINVFATGVDKRFDGMDRQFEGIYARLDRIEADLVDIKKRLEFLEKRTLEDDNVMVGDILKLKTRVDELEKQLKQLQLLQRAV